jgi:uncharacterized membrane-anchored protein YhcB (DUF1043 family)
MKVLLIILGIVAGVAIAWVFNKFLSGKIANQQLPPKAVA